MYSQLRYIYTARDIYGEYFMTTQLYRGEGGGEGIGGSISLEKFIYVELLIHKFLVNKNCIIITLIVNHVDHVRTM